MCVNRGLYCPLRDEVADLLGIPRRKYLAKSQEIFDVVVGNFPQCKDFDWSMVSYKLHNFGTCNDFTPRISNKVVIKLDKK